MFSKIKIWHFLAFCLSVILILRFNTIIELFILFYQFIGLLIEDSSAAVNQLDLNLFDHFLSPFLLIVLLVLTIAGRRRIKLLNQPVKFAYGILIVLLLVTLLAPLITVTHPEFQHNIRVSKLLSPFSSRQLLIFSENNDSTEDIFSKFLKSKKYIIKHSTNDNIVVADSIKPGPIFTVYQKEKVRKISLDSLRVNSKTAKIGSIFFPLGTDEFGRDIFSRIVYGTRLSIFIGLGSVIVSFLIGVTLGFFAGYFGGLIDILSSRFTEMFLAFPIIFLIILIIALFGNSLIVVIFVLGFSGWMSLFKIVRGEVISIKNKDFIVTARLLGFSNWRILFKEMLPLILSPIIVNLIFQYGNVIMAEAALSYLGLGIGNQLPTWGGMIEEGQYYLAQAWWISFFPCFILFLTLVTANDLGRKLEGVFNPVLEK